MANPKLDGSNGTGYNVYIPMGMTAENVAERCKVLARGPGRAGGRCRSSVRSRRARAGHFDREIVGVDIPETHDAGGDAIAAHTVTQDDGPRAGTTVESLAKSETSL